MASVSYLLLIQPCFSFMIMKSSDTPVSRVLIRSFREEGPTFLFKGWVPAFVRLAPNTVLLFVFLEVCCFLSTTLVRAD